MENDERTEHKRILEDIIRKYAMNTLSGTPKALAIGITGLIKFGGSSILNNLIDQGFVKPNAPLFTKMIVYTEHGQIEILTDEYNRLVKEIFKELCDEDFLTLTSGRYSLSVVSPNKIDDKVHNVKQAPPEKVKTESTLTVGNVAPLGIIVAIFLIVISGFQFSDEGYWFNDGEMQSWTFPGLSPARGVTGDWSGSHFIEENMGNPSWSAKGGTILDLKQNGNDITGTYIIEDYRSGSISGTISSGIIEFTDGFVRFKGGITSDTMTLQVESCSLNQYCMDPNVGDGKFTSGGVSGSYVKEPGIKGNIVLYKGSGNMMTSPGIVIDMPDPNKPIGNYPEGYVP